MSLYSRSVFTLRDWGQGALSYNLCEAPFFLDIQGKGIKLSQALFLRSVLRLRAQSFIQWASEVWWMISPHDSVTQA